MGRAITKTAYAAGQACPLRGYRSVVRGDWGAAAPPPRPELAVHRMRDRAIDAVHRLWLRGGTPAAAHLPALAEGCWRQAGGEGPLDPAEVADLADYVRSNPFLAGRRLLAVQPTLAAVAGGRRYQCRPDALATEGEWLVALEITGARHPLLDERAVATMAAIDQLCMAGPDLPARYRAMPRRVVVCALRDRSMTDVTLPPAAVRDTLAELAGWAEGLAAAARGGDLEARPGPDTCPWCQYRDECPEGWTA